MQKKYCKTAKQMLNAQNVLQDEKKMNTTHGEYDKWRARN